MMLDYAVSIIFDAVSILRCGRFDESMDLFKSVLYMIQQTAHDQGFKSGTRGAIVSIPVKEEDDLFPQAFEGLSSADCSNLFDRAFIFDVSSSLTYTNENAALCVSVVLYNLALSMHLKGLTNGGPSFLYKALRLYERAYSILQALAPHPTDSASSLLLATVLNLVNCQIELGGSQSAEPWTRLYMVLYPWATQSFQALAVTRYPDESLRFAASYFFFFEPKVQRSRGSLNGTTAPGSSWTRHPYPTIGTALSRAYYVQACIY